MTWPAPYVAPLPPEPELAPELREMADKAEAEAEAERAHDVEMWSAC
jgi:hypothetical protein